LSQSSAPVEGHVNINNHQTAVDVLVDGIDAAVYEDWMKGSLKESAQAPLSLQWCAS
jgi:hypothetical protein